MKRIHDLNSARKKNAGELYMFSLRSFQARASYRSGHELC
jgi:hypothetical protein